MNPLQLPAPDDILKPLHSLGSICSGGSWRLNSWSTVLGCEVVERACSADNSACRRMTSTGRGSLARGFIGENEARLDAVERVLRYELPWPSGLKTPDTIFPGESCATEKC